MGRGAHKRCNSRKEVLKVLNTPPASPESPISSQPGMGPVFDEFVWEQVHEEGLDISAGKGW